MGKISAVILYGGNYNRTLLKKCLGSVSWCDEIVRLETDNLKGSFADWRNVGAKKANGDWLFYIDSDEECTSLLRKEIQKAVKSGNCAGYAIPRQNIFLGHKMRWGGWWPDRVLRLIKKSQFLGWYCDLHEQPKIDGEICNLKEPLVHVSHRNLTDMVEKTNKWSEIEARLLYNSGHPKMNFLRFFSAGLREIWFRGVMKLGFLDGTVGIIEIMYQTYSRLITYSKLWELQIKHESRNL